MKPNKVIQFLHIACITSIVIVANQPQIIGQTEVAQDRLSPFSFEKPKLPKLGLALSGGGSRGLFQIGVIKAFEEEKIPIDFLVGTSMGSIIGGLYAIGYTTEDLEKLAVTLNWSELVDFDDKPRRSTIFLDQKELMDKSLIKLELKDWKPVIPLAASSGQKMTNTLNELSFRGIYYPAPTYDSFRVNYRSLAVNLENGEQIVFEKGDLTDAMRSSMAFPLLITPFHVNGMQLIDGGVMTNIPVDVARKYGCDWVVAVNATGTLKPIEEINAPWKSADQIISIMMKLSNQVQLGNADYTIRMSMDQQGGFDFSNLDSIIKNGYNEAKKITHELKAKYYTYEEENGMPIHEIIFSEDSPIQNYERELPKNQLAIIRELNEYGYFQSYEVIEKDDKNILYPKLFPRVDLLEIKGINNVPEDIIRKYFLELVGKPYNYHEWLKNTQNLLRLYKSHGFALVTITSFEYSEEEKKLTINLDEGYIQHINVRGNTYSYPSFVNRELSISKNEVLTFGAVRSGLNNLVSTELYDQVSLGTVYEPTGYHLQVKLKEKEPIFLRAGFNASETYHAQLFINLRNENVFGFGNKMDVTIYGGDRNISTGISTRIGRIFDTYFSFTGKINYDNREQTVNQYVATYNGNTYQSASRNSIGEYVFESTKLSGSFGRQFSKFGEVSFEFYQKYSNVYYHNGNVNNSPFTPNSYKLNALKINSLFDNRDHPLIPKDGWFIQFYFESAVQPLGSNLTFNKIYTKMETTIPFLPRTTVTPSFEYGSADLALPETEYFFSGGARTFYGYREFDLFGRQIIMSHLEFRWHTPTIFIFDIILHARYDLGNVWARQNVIKFSDLVHGVGSGVTMDTPIGAISLSAGRYFQVYQFPFSGVGWGPWTVYFNIGNSFF